MSTILCTLVTLRAVFTILTKTGRRCPARRAPALGNAHTSTHLVSALEAGWRCPARFAPALSNAHTHTHSLPALEAGRMGLARCSPVLGARTHEHTVGDLAWGGCPPRAQPLRFILWENEDARPARHLSARHFSALSSARTNCIGPFWRPVSVFLPMVLLARRSQKT